MATEYTVQKIHERMKLTDKGELIKVYHVEAITTAGTHFTLDLSETEAIPVEAQKLLKAKAVELDTLLKS